jgi:DNA-binding NtrC family response regulator
MISDKKRILIIDDDEDILETLHSLLTRKGYAAETANCGMVAVEKSLSSFFNLALIDIVLPDMEGTQLLVKLKPTVPKMRKIIITGHAALDNAIKAVNMGADAYLMKPVNPQELIKTVEEQLKLQEEDTRITQDKISSYVAARVKQLKEEEND